jgi:hypothetical protein
MTTYENPESASTSSSTWSKPHSDLVAFARRPSKANYGAPVRLQTNSFRFVNTNPSIKDINKYAVSFEPSVPANSRIDNKILKGVREEIKKDLNFMMFCHGNLYSYTLMKDDKVYVTEYDGQKYEVKISWTKSIKPNDMELYSFYSIFFKNLMKLMNFERVGRNCFNPKAAV